ncbi:hypothetical protein BU15DRAFT_67796 [Melanogaster broomeanus]|nr:hypothetical protein BU15DRAFT_67796 [Melanogaster broomeanus]
MPLIHPTFYYGYAVTEHWLLEQAAKHNLQNERTELAIVSVAMRIRGLAGLLGYSLLKRVMAPPAGGGPDQEYWCFALATNNRRECLPLFRGKGIPPVSEDSYQLLKEILGKDHPPCWYPYAG